jgi:transcriptional regulator with XRE-family HTH domain
MPQMKHGYPVVDGNAIRDRRLALGMTMRELGKRSKTSLNTVYRLERGGPALPGTAKALADALGCSPNDIYVNDKP